MHGDFFDYPLLQGDENGDSIFVQRTLLPMQDEREDRSDEERRKQRGALLGTPLPSTDREAKVGKKAQTES